MRAPPSLRSINRAGHVSRKAAEFDGGRQDHDSPPPPCAAPLSGVPMTEAASPAPRKALCASPSTFLMVLAFLNWLGYALSLIHI